MNKAKTYIIALGCMLSACNHTVNTNGWAAGEVRVAPASAMQEAMGLLALGRVFFLKK